MSDTTPMFSDDDIMELIGSVEAHDFDRIAPPSMVWENIATELEVELAEAEAEARRRSVRWWSTSPRVLAAAAALLIIGLVATLTVAPWSRDADDGFDELATATMTDADLPVSTQETAVATFVCDEAECAVDVDLTALPDVTDGVASDLELWVINGDVTDMHSLGLVTESGRFALPPGVTPDDFPIVDISVEPRDGDSTHSGQSVLRGVFESG